MEVKDLIQQLNLTDECNWIEAKRASAIDRSIMETVNSFSNEPGLGGGYLVLGVEQEEASLFPSYVLTDLLDTDKLQLDLSSQCASMFNIPIRPEIKVEIIDGKKVISVFVPELPDTQKPVYFKNEGLPRGAYRRIGSSDQRCTDDDLFVFFNNDDSLDGSIVQKSSWDDISEEAVELYRSLRAKVNTFAEELQYDDVDLLHSLGCIIKEKDAIYLTYAGLLLFGKRSSHRRLMPMVRVDYIRVPGNVWIEDPENRFTTIDMRGSLLEMVQRIFSQITDDLPKGFLLPEGELQAENIGLPSRVLREAIVNSLIHRTYRENQPIQIIRYSNRIEIKNPGFSLKPEEFLGEPGSKNRNPFIAAVFHETNLAETKGSGIRSMRTLMSQAKLMPPTFESDHGRNQFTARLLLHHFLGVEDIRWLTLFDSYALNEDQKKALIFVKELGAIDNNAYRQLNTVDTLKASQDLRDLKRKEILDQKGKGKATYYIPGEKYVNIDVHQLSTRSAQVDGVSAPANDLSAPVIVLSTPAVAVSTLADTRISTELKLKIAGLGQRINDNEKLKSIIMEICTGQYFKSTEIARILLKREDYLKRKFLKPMIENGELEYQYPEMPNHPNQAYTKK
ncbi:ATP-binding protein [Chryseobacterium sp.]|uniref:ATP-binding protein n=1 Tax=Chryseobacterium sp. TaxID=1871047 RepID=UPI0011C93E20|nr:ATP-binding protein [Chryseobacterium sp.]TXF78837.1 AAA family ATPase [Chryseobacterium sp.]